jgi:hypothetical protein
MSKREQISPGKNTDYRGISENKAPLEEFYLLRYNAVQSVDSEPTFGTTARLHFHGRRISQVRNQLGIRWGRYVLPKRRLTFNGLHGVIFQKIESFITTAVRTSNPVSSFLF